MLILSSDANKALHVYKIIMQSLSLFEKEV